MSSEDQDHPTGTMPPLCSPADFKTRTPNWFPPRGAVDTHTHIFEDFYEMAAYRSYTPPVAKVSDLLEMHRSIGVDRLVLVQPSIYGLSNRSILDSLDRLSDGARGVVAADPSLSERELARLQQRGVRGVRLNLHKASGSTVSLDALPEYSRKIASVGWHIEFVLHPGDFADIFPILQALKSRVVIGHFGYVSVQSGVTASPFRRLLELVRDGNTWVKLSAPYRLGASVMPPWPEVVPFARDLLEAAPNRMLWGTDWPHPFLFGEVPNDADIVEQLPLWAPSESVRQLVLVENPEHLYGF